MAEKRVLLKELFIRNLGPIKEDRVALSPLTYFVGRNNAGKSHYLRAIELLLASKAPPAEEIFTLQCDKSKDIEIEGAFEGVENHAASVSKSNHKAAIEQNIKDGILTVVRRLNSQEGEESILGVYNSNRVLKNR